YLHQYDALWGYLRDLYQLPGVSETVRMDHIKTAYYRSRSELNPRQIVARGPDIDLEAPHERDALARNPLT
ncbi:MAG: glutathione S-transferase family protein, partial [Halobacteriaceae archaeon]